MPSVTSPSISAGLIIPTRPEKHSQASLNSASLLRETIEPVALIVFDSRVQKLAHLHTALLPHAIAYTITETEDALDAITRLLAETGAKRLAIVAHGKPGAITLGAHQLDIAHLQQRAALLQEWNVEDIALYSCEVAQGEGIGFVRQLGALTGAAIAATAGYVGSAALGGHWQLEVQTGKETVPQMLAVSKLNTYPDLLASSGFGANFDLSKLNGTNGFRIDGAMAGDFSGSSVSNAGDVNGDGVDDLLIGAVRASLEGEPNVGASYVVFGRTTGFKAKLNLAGLNGTNGFRLVNSALTNSLGFPVSNAGDVNGDGIGDLLFGTFSGSPNDRTLAGASYVVFGKNTGFDASSDVTTLDGANGFRIDGARQGDYSGRSVSSAGDINGDGIDDLVVGAVYGGGAEFDRAGAAFVVFGSTAGFEAIVDLRSLDGTNGFLIDGVDYDNGGFGDSVSDAGDVNGDGIDDLLISSPSQASYVVFGKTTDFDAKLDITTIDGTNGFQIEGDINDFPDAPSVSSAGDVNGDNINDLIIGGPIAAYVVFGKSTGFEATFNATNLNGTNGFQLNGAVTSVGSAGDINGDGIDDLLIGASSADPGGRKDAGASYVVFGKATGFGAALNLSSLNGTNGFKINGLAPDDLLGSSVSKAGDINGDGVDDLIINALGADPGGRTNAGSSYVIFGRLPDPTVRIRGARVEEGAKGKIQQARFVVTLSDATNQTVSLDYRTVDGRAKASMQDYKATEGTLTFAPGETEQVIKIKVFGDRVYEKDENFFLRFNNVANAHLGDSTVRGLILNDDPLPQMSVAEGVL